MSRVVRGGFPDLAGATGCPDFAAPAGPTINSGIVLRQPQFFAWLE